MLSLNKRNIFYTLTWNHNSHSNTSQQKHIMHFILKFLHTKYICIHGRRLKTYLFLKNDREHFDSGIYFYFFISQKSYKMFKNIQNKYRKELSKICKHINFFCRIFIKYPKIYFQKNNFFLFGMKMVFNNLNKACYTAVYSVSFYLKYLF